MVSSAFLIDVPVVVTTAAAIAVYSADSRRVGHAARPSLAPHPMLPMSFFADRRFGVAGRQSLVDLLADALVGPIFLRRLMTNRPFDPASVGLLVDQLLPTV